MAIANDTFSREEVLSDLETLRDSLESSHYNAFAYVPEHQFDKTFHDLKDSVRPRPYNLLETINLYQQLVSSLNNGHTEIDFPVASYLDYVKSGGTVFPLELAFENGKARVRKNLSANQSIAPGTELVSINGVEISKILAEIYPLISAERLYLKHAKLELFSFPRYYWRVFGQEPQYVVELTAGSTRRSLTIQAIAAMEGYERRRREILEGERKLQFTENAAYLNPGNFSGDEAAYRTFIADAFRQINTLQTENLIIDLKDNGGGGDAFSDYLVSYIADKPFMWNSSFTLKTSELLKKDTKENRDTSEPYWKAILENPEGTIYEYDFEPYEPQPAHKRYRGNVYVLVNRQSHSQAAVTAAQIQDYKWGVIAGEETGDYPSLHASQFQFVLPVTGIRVKVSKGYIVRVNGSTAEQGVIPDIVIRDHLLDEQDEILDGILQKLTQAR